MRFFLIFVVLVACSTLANALNCDVSSLNRTDCGISVQSACLSAGCCWSSSNPSQPFCFEASQESSTSTTTTTTPLPSSGSSFTEKFYEQGSLPFCSQCAAPSAYACSDRANWVGSFNFTDRVPSGSIAQKLTVTALGSYACAAANTVTLAFYLNGSPINMVELVKSSDACACNTCDGPAETSFSSNFGFPGYLYGAVNTLEVVVQPSSQTVCLASVELEVEFKEQFQLASVAEVLTWRDASISASRGLRCTDDSYTHVHDTGVLYNFEDPLPSGQLLIAASVTLYGSYFGVDSTCPQNVSATVELQAHQVGASTIVAETLQAPYVANPCSSMCNGDWLFTSSNVYQNGWPGYVYGRTNSIFIEPSSSIDLNYVVVQLFYYPAPTPTAGSNVRIVN